jgi:mono/diheme cytochrome c family protein
MDWIFNISEVLGLDLSRSWLAKVLISLGILMGHCVFAESLEIATPGKSIKLSLAQLKSKLRMLNVEIEDPVYGKTKKYDGFLLTDVLQLGGMQENAAADEMVFTAKDGYAPNTSFEELKKHEAYLVFEETGTKGKFALIEQGKTKLSPGPFYVVWKEGAKLAHEVPWPYQLVKIEAVSFKEKYAKVFPAEVKADSAERKGFAIFKQECLRCHSINLQGGEIGPELNAPQNVTEYWRSNVLESFIKNAPSFRYKSKMPAFPNLTTEDVNHLIAYLRYMARHKIEAP